MDAQHAPLRGNIAVIFPDGGRIFLSTRTGGEDLALMLADALGDLRLGVAAEVAGWVAARLMEHGEPEMSLARTIGDVDEYHVDAEKREVVQVTLDILEDGATVHVMEREVARWSFDAFMEEACGVPTAERALLLG